MWNEQGELVMDLVPDLTSSNVVCLYDMATGTLRTATQGTFEAGPTAVPTPSVPIDIVCNNGVIKFGKRLTLDSARYYSYIYTDNTWKYSNDSYCIVIPVSVGHKYKITVPTTNPLNNIQNTIFRYGFADTINEDWKNDNLTGQTSIPIYDYVRTTPQDLPSVEVAATHPYLVIQMGAAVFSYILTNNLITVIDQTTYTDGTVETVKDSLDNTATAQNLFAVGTVKDVQEVLTGAITRNIGIKVLDGTESWTKASGYTNLFYAPLSGAYYNDTSAERIAVPCTHFVGTDATNTNMTDNTIKLTAQGSALTNPLIYIKASVSENDLTTWQTWLATQYAASTPVIIIFPKKTATTETVENQALTIQAGTNTIEITQASIDNLGLEVSYKWVV